MKKITKTISLTIIITLLLTTTATATDLDFDFEEHQVEPVNFTFIYSDGNTTTYQGDLGLDGCLYQDRNTNKTYFAGDGLTRAMAKMTKKTFKFDEAIKVRCYPDTRYEREEYYTNQIHYLNGTQCRPLLISDDKLTSEERQYFDNYEQQKQDYQIEQEKANAGIESIDSSVSHHKKSGISVGSSGVNYYHEL